MAEAIALGKYEAIKAKSVEEAADLDDTETSEDSTTVVINEVTCKTDEVL